VISSKKWRFACRGGPTFTEELANEAKLRAAQASLSEKGKFEEVAMEWSALAKSAEQKQR
jgi:hypothetical protein